MTHQEARHICVVTGSRAEYGLLRPVMQRVRDSQMRLSVVATGSHLSPEFGLTYREIEQDGFAIARRVEMLMSADTPSAIAKSMGVALISFGSVLAELEPDLVVLLGDRFEIFAVAAAATVARIPIAHIHGGETTTGAIDEAFRHSITKMSHLHCVAAEEYRRRVIQLGEHPDRVFVVGGLGVDNIVNAELMDRAELQDSLGLAFGPRSLLVTYHPVTLQPGDAVRQTEELLAALAARPDIQLIFTAPNADNEGRVIGQLIAEFVRGRANAHLFTSLGVTRFLSCLKYVDGMLGNSSSGLIEMPSFRKGTINIGERQHGRLRAASVIDCAPDRQSIEAALERLYSPEFQRSLPAVKNPYGDGGAAARIVGVLQQQPLEGILKKLFHDLPGVGI